MKFIILFDNIPLVMKKSVYKLFFIFLTAAFFSQSCAEGEKEYHKADFALGTVCSVKIYTNKGGREVEKIFGKVFSELNRLEEIFSANSGHSVLQNVNDNAGKKSVEVPAELYSLLERAVYFAQKTDSAFNPAIGAVVKLWNIGMENPSVPTEENLKKALKKIDYKKIELKNGSVFLTEEGMQLDLGGIAKGYAADCIKTILLGEGIERGIIDLGGNVCTIGLKQDGSPWRVGIRNPVIGNDRSSAAYLEVSDKTVVTSGDYERFFEKDGKIYHHILSSKTGYPAENDLRAVTIVADTSADADALSTSFFVLGLEKSLQLIKSFPGVSAAFFMKDNSVTLAGKKLEVFKILDDKLFIRDNLMQ